MAFQAYLLREFEHPHERTMFATLVAQLAAKFTPLPGRHLLLGNVMFDGNDLDALFLKSSGMSVLEMKAYGGKLLFRENAPWIVGTQEVRGGSRENPFQQVRAYRYGLSAFLRNHQAAILQTNRVVEWSHVSALVVFNQPIEFEERFLNALRAWFGITDLARIADRLVALGSGQLSLTVAEMDGILHLLGIDDRYRYLDKAPAEASQALTTSPLPARPSQLVYLKELAFREHDLRMRNRAGARSQGAQRVRALFEEIRQGLSPFAMMTSRADGRVQGAAIYSINSVTELVLIQNDFTVFPAFLGEPAEVEGWLAAHEGLVVTLDAASGRLSMTRVLHAPDAQKLDPPALTTSPRSLLRHLEGLQLSELVTSRLLRDHLLELDEFSTEEDIRERLEMVGDADLRLFLFDLINLVRSGDHAGATARLNLRIGAALPVDDAGPSAQDAAASGANSDQALVINTLTEEELNRLLDPQHFQDWMLFLHPDQKCYAETTFDRPVVLTGVSGSGKTCVLVHRARYLARKYPGERIGILTLSRTLAGLLQNLVNRLLTPDDRRNVVVHAFYDVFRDCLKVLGPDDYFAQLAGQVRPESNMLTVLRQAHAKWPQRMVWDCDPISKAMVEDEWEQFFMSRNESVKEWMDPLVRYLEEYHIDASRYLEEEFTLIRSAFPVPARQGYLDTEDRAIRAGRCISLRRQIRADLLRLLLYWEEWLLAGGMIDNLGLTQALMPLHSKMQSLPESLRFRCLLVDEFQDFSSLDLQLLRRVVPLAEPDALFLAGDTVQRILVKKLSLGAAGLDRGPAVHKSILKNYRNSRQVLLAASRLANHYGAVAKAQGEELELLDPELAQRETNPPVVLKTSEQIAKAWEIVLECTQETQTEPWTVCVATAAPHRLTVEEILRQRPASLAARALSGDCILHLDEVVVGTITDLKGFEFRLVIILGCDAGIFPEVGVPSDEAWRDALRLYVAMTRARDQVYLLHGEAPSPFIGVLGDAVLQRQEPILRHYRRAELPQPPAPPLPAPVGNAVQRAAPRLDWDENCESWFSEAELEVLRRYFAVYVYRENLTFHEWMTPRGLQGLQPERFLSLRNCGRSAVLHLLNTVRGRGLVLPTLPPQRPNRPAAPAMNSPKALGTQPASANPGRSVARKCATPGCHNLIHGAKKYCKQCRKARHHQPGFRIIFPQSPARKPGECRACGSPAIPGEDYCYSHSGG